MSPLDPLSEFYSIYSSFCNVHYGLQRRVHLLQLLYDPVGIEYFYNTNYNSLAVPITNSFTIRYTTIEPTPGIEEYGKLDNLPLQTRMSVVYPNPFMRRTSISYQLASRGRISLSVYDAAGRLVSDLADGVMDPGYYTVHWDGYDEHQRRVPAGVYFVKLSADEYQRVVKTVLLK